MKIINSRFLVRLSIPLLLAACGPPSTEEASAPEVATEAEVSGGPDAESEATEPVPCPDTPNGNQPFEWTDCWTTDSGPAKADIISGNPLTSPNMLYCDGGTYALCFFSGPLEATGNSNTPLPCTPREGEEVADCICQAYTSGPYFIDINAILNLGAYSFTVSECGADGSRCANIENCGQDGSKSTCEDYKPATVCSWVAGQNPTDPSTSLIPGAQVISTFSFAMGTPPPSDGPYTIGSTHCDGLYAGCMTAPCFAEPGTEITDEVLVRCECPTYDGTYQAGQLGMECPQQDSDPPPGWLWSASNQVSE